MPGNSKQNFKVLIYAVFYCFPQDNSTYSTYNKIDDNIVDTAAVIDVFPLIILNFGHTYSPGPVALNPITWCNGSSLFDKIFISYKLYFVYLRLYQI